MNRSFIFHKHPTPIATAGFGQQAGSPTNSLCALDISSSAILRHDLTGATRWSGVNTMSDASSSIVVSAAAVAVDRPILVSPLNPSDTNSVPVLSVASVVADTSFMIVANTVVTSALPVSWAVIR